MSSLDTPSRPVDQDKRKAIIAGAAGNFVEWFDWSIYGYFATYFSSQFFPKGNDIANLLSTFLVFALGFFFRPLGGAILGSYTDRHGRKAGLTLTILMMAGASLVIGLIPTWGTIGVFAPILLVLARIVQGFSAGGEFGASSAFMVEKADPHDRGFLGSWQQVSVGLGTLGASLFSALMFSLLSAEQISAYGWRIAFILGGVLGLLGLYLRTQVSDTTAFQEKKAAGEVTHRPLLTVFREHPRAAFQVFGMVAAGSVMYHMWLIYMPTFSKLRNGSAMSVGQLATTITLAVFICVLPFTGRLSDKIGRKPVMLGFAIGSAVAVIPLLLMTGPSLVAIVIPQIIGAVIMTGYSGPLAAVMAEQFPTSVRAAGIAMPYGLSVAIFGGLTPYLATYLMTHQQSWTFMIYMVVVCLFSAVVFATMRETRGKDLQ